MSIQKGASTWSGTLKTGRGEMRPEHGPEVPFSLGTRFEGEPGSNPEEMIGAALSGCFSMALAAALERIGMTPSRIDTSADVHLEKDAGGFAIPKIDLVTTVRASGGDAAKLEHIAMETKKQCPVGKALAAVEISLTVKLER